MEAIRHLEGDHLFSEDRVSRSRLDILHETGSDFVNLFSTAGGERRSGRLLDNRNDPSS